MTSLYGQVPEITQLVNRYDWFITPVSNPDGYTYSWTSVTLFIYLKTVFYLDIIQFYVSILQSRPKRFFVILLIASSIEYDFAFLKYVLDYKQFTQRLLSQKEIELSFLLTQDRLWRKNRTPTFNPTCIGPHSLRN